MAGPLGILISAAMLAQAPADTGSAADTAAVELPGLEVKARRRPGAGIQDGTRLDADYFRAHRRTTVAATLDRQPGMAVLSTGVGIAKPVIRGLAGIRIVSLVDGLKQEGQQWGADHGLELDPFMVSGATVVKGSGALRHGSDALGGVLAFSTLAPTGGPGRRFRAEQAYHSNNDQVSGSWTAEWQGETRGLVLHAGGQAYGDYRVPADSFTYNGFRLPVAGGRLKNSAGLERGGGLAWTQNGPSSSLRVSARIYDLDAGLFAGAVGPPRAYLLRDDGDARDRAVPGQKVTHAAASLAWRRDGEAGSLSLHGGHQWNHRRELSPAHHHGVIVTGDPRLAVGLRLHTSSAKAEATRRAGREARATVGLEGRVQVNRRDGFEFLLPAYERREAGAYGIWEQSLGRHLDWSVGARWDLAATETHPHAVDMRDDGTGRPGRVERAPATSRLDANPSYSLGLSRRWPDRGLEAGVHLGRSFRVPHPSETVSNGIHHGNFRHEQGDTSLRSEKGWQLDLSLKTSRGSLTAEASPFAWYVEDYIHLAPTGRFSPLPEAGQVYRYRQHDAWIAGGEIAWSWEAGPWRLEQGWEYLWNRNLATRLPLPFTPPWTVNASGAYRREGRTAAWGLRLEGRYVAAQERVDRNEPPTPGCYLFDGGLDVELRLRGWKPMLRLGMLNLADTRYRGHLSRYRILNLPEPGRNWTLGLTLPLEGGRR